MRTEELFYPELQVVIGPYVLQEGITFTSYSDPKTPYDWCRILFTEEFQGSIQVEEKAEVEVYAGYGGSLQLFFKGLVAKNYNQAGAKDEILVKDYSLKLAETKVTNTFLDVSPQELVQYSLQEAGIIEYELTDQVYRPKGVVSVIQKTVVEFLKEINALWNIQADSYFQLGKFYWGMEPEQQDIYVFEYGSNIISLTRENSFWVLLTVSVPFIGHSQLIEVEHPYVSGEFLVSRVSCFVNEDGWLRTKIWFQA